MISISVCVLSVLLAANPIELSEILSLKIPRDIALSPDGESVAFTVGWTDTLTGRSMSEIRIAETSGSTEPTVLVPASADPWSPAFSPDGASLAFFSVDGSGRQVWTVPAAGGSPRKITMSSSVRSFRWRPDGAGVVTLVESPGQSRSTDPILEGAQRPGLEFQFTPLSGSGPRKLFKGDAGIDDWDIDAIGEHIVYSSNGTGVPDHENRFDLFILTLADGKIRQLTSRFGPETHPRFSPDGTMVAFQADRDTSVTFSKEEIFIAQTSGGRLWCLTCGYGYPATGPEWSPWRRTAGEVEVAPGFVTQPRAEPWSVVATSSIRAGAGLIELSRPKDASYTVVPGSRELQPLGSVKIPGAPGYLGSFATPVKGFVDAGIVEDSLSWGRVMARTWSRSEEWMAVGSDAAIPTDRIPKMTALTWPSEDNTEIEGILLTPPSGAPPYPTILILHGGPYNRATNRIGGSDTAVVLASHGYLVLMPNYRGSKGYGEAFAQALRGDPGRLEIEDINSGLDSLIAQGVADPDRLGILGWSYGGYLTNLAITKTDRFKAAVTMYGMSSLENDYYFGESPSYELEYLGGPPWERPELYRDRSPLTHVNRIHTPLLLLHGEKDAKVSVMHAKAMWTALTELGRPVELARYPGEGHGLRQYDHKIDASRRTTAWFDNHLRKRTR